MTTARASIRRVVGAIQTDPSVREVLLGGSVARGEDDDVSDLDLWVVADDWKPTYLAGLLIAAQVVPRGSATQFHCVDCEGVIVDVVTGCDAPADFEPLERASFEPWPAGALEPEGLFTNFWISSYKHRKPLWRNLDAMATFGLHFDRMALLQAWVLRDSGSPAGPGMFTIHGLAPVVREHVTPERQELLGLPSRTRAELLTAISANRQEMRRLDPSDSQLSRIVLADPVFVEMTAAIER